MASQRPPQRRRGDQDSSGGGGAASIDGVLLPGDALYEILLRVPARPLCRFRAACRSWRSLLADPHFAAAHAAHHRRRRENPDPLFAVCVTAGSHGEAADILLLDTSGRVVKRQSVGPSFLVRQMQPHLDLVLLRRLAGVDPGHPLRVLDPATGAIFALPYDHDAISPPFVLGRALTSTGGHGDYKVLSLGVASSPYATPPCKVLTLDVGNGGSHGVWRVVAPGPPVRISTLRRRSKTVVAAGVVYHLVGSSSSRHSWRIAAFDLEAEQWRPALLQGPPAAEASAGSHITWRSLAEVNGRLAAVCTTVSAMDIWWLLASGSGSGEQQALWCKLCRVLNSSIQRRHGLFVDGEPPLLWVTEDGRVTLLVHMGGNRTVVLWMYDLRTETCTYVAAVENYLNVGVGLYTGNLLRLV